MSVLEKIFCNLYIGFTVIDDLLYPPLFPPFQGLETVRCLFLTQCYSGKVIKRQPVAETLMYFFKNIKGRKLSEIKIRVSSKYMKIKPFDVKTDNKIESFKVLDE